MAESYEPGEIDLTPLRNVIDRFRESLAVYQAEPENPYYLDSVIKRFELTYEVSRKILMRFLKANSIAMKDENPTLPYAVRTANQDGLLLGTWVQWHAYREQRNNTSHAYDEEKARKIAAVVPNFLAEAEYLYARMKERLERDAATS